MKGRKVEANFEREIWDAAYILYQWTTLNPMGEDELIKNSKLYKDWSKAKEAPFDDYVKTKLGLFSPNKRLLIKLIWLNYFKHTFLDYLHFYYDEQPEIAQDFIKSQMREHNIQVGDDGLCKSYYPAMSPQCDNVPNFFERYLSKDEIEKSPNNWSEAHEKNERDAYRDECLFVYGGKTVKDDKSPYHGNTQTVQYDFFIDWSLTNNKLQSEFKNWLESRRPEGSAPKRWRDEDSEIGGNLRDFKYWHLIAQGSKGEEKAECVRSNNEGDKRSTNAIRNSVNKAKYLLELCFMGHRYIGYQGSIKLNT